jgi:hypothetical protein
MPGHAASWTAGIPTITARCPKYEHNINNIPLDPTQDSTYTTVNQVLQWLQGMFTDSCFHLGGDEVVTSCWKNDSAIAQWATAHNVSYPGLLTLFLGKVQQQVMASGRVPIHWQEAFENAFPPTAASAAASSTSAPAPVSAASGTAVGASSALANSTIIQVPYRTQRKPSECTADCWVFVFQVWKDAPTVQRVIEHGFRAIVSVSDPWYVVGRNGGVALLL